MDVAAAHHQRHSRSSKWVGVGSSSNPSSLRDRITGPQRPTLPWVVARHSPPAAPVRLGVRLRRGAGPEDTAKRTAFAHQTRSWNSAAARLRS